MFEIRIERDFCAAHALVIGGTREPVHGHNWHVTVVAAGLTLDGDGLLCDFHELERRLDAVLEPFRNADLNATPPFDRINPSAERIAQHVGETLAGELVPGVRISRVSVTEAPRCTATYRMDGR